MSCIINISVEEDESLKDEESDEEPMVGFKQIDDEGYE